MIDGVEVTLVLLVVRGMVDGGWEKWMADG